MALVDLPEYTAGDDLAVITIDGVIFITYTRCITRTIETGLQADVPGGSELVYTITPTTGTVVVAAQDAAFVIDIGVTLTADSGVYHTPTRGLVVAPLVDA